MTARASTCPDCGNPVALVDLSTGTGPGVALDPTPVPSATAAVSVAYVLNRATRAAVPLGDVHRPPGQCYVQHRCPQRRERDLYAELGSITDDLDEWAAQAAAYAYPSGIPADASRRLA